MCAGNLTLARADGLHLLCRAALAELTADDRLRNFADGLITQAILALPARYRDPLTLAEALHHSDLAFHPLITSLLVLDAELTAVVDDETRLLPLPGFLSYRPQLPPTRFPLNTLRLPPLNSDGHYLCRTTADHTAAVRLDLHPQQKVAGHVRIALGGADRLPQRLPAAEHRLNRQTLTERHIETSLAAANPPLTTTEQNILSEMLSSILAT